MIKLYLLNISYFIDCIKSHPDGKGFPINSKLTITKKQLDF